MSATASLSAEAIRAPPAVPPQRSAAIQPVWIDDRLVVPSEPAASDLPQQGLMAAYSAARIVLRRAIEALAGGNVDPRVIEFARGVLALIPEGPPDQVAVFVLALEVEAFQSVLAQSVAEGSLSAEQAARLDTAARHLERCINQHPTWRDFCRNAAARQLTAEQIDDAPKLALALAELFETDDAAKEIIDASVPNALRTLAEPPKSGAPSLSKDVAAFDLVESLGNIIAKIAEAALSGLIPAARMAAKGVVAAGKLAGKGVQAVGGAVGKGTLKGIEAVAAAVVVGGAITLTAQSGIIPTIVAKYPILSEFQPIIEHIAHMK